MTEFDHGSPKESLASDRQELIIALQQQLEEARAAESQALKDQQASGEVSEAWIDARETKKRIEQELERLIHPPGPSMKRPALSDAQILESMGKQLDARITNEQHQEDKEE